MAITHLDLHQKMMEVSGQDFSVKKIRVLDYLSEHLQIDGDEIATSALENFMRQSFFPNYLRKWKSAGRKESYFLSRYEDWLRNEIIFPNEGLPHQQGYAIPESSPSTSGKAVYINSFIETNTKNLH